MKDKKGSTIVWGFVLIFVSLFLAIGLGLSVYGFNLFYTHLAQDVDIGQVNLKNITDTTYGQLNTGLLNNADTIGIILLIGMCLLMIVNGYAMSDRYPKLFWLVDFFLLVVFFIPAYYISYTYGIFLDGINPITTVFIDVIPKTSKFVLNLPIITSTVGILTMIVTYASLRKDKLNTGEPNVQGY